MNPGIVRLTNSMRRGAANNVKSSPSRWRKKMKWITREYVKVDRVACPWLIKKFVDKSADFIFVPADKVMEEAKRLDAI
ncbi:MAG: chromate resistance protein ChrB domain-containing protein, partial [Pseudolabrys sp.]